jgi:hypothetical protein
VKPIRSVQKKCGDIVAFDSLPLYQSMVKALLRDEKGELKSAAKPALNRIEVGRVHGLLAFVLIFLELKRVEIVQADEIRAAIKVVLQMLGEKALWESMESYRLCKERPDEDMVEEVDWTPRVAGPYSTWNDLYLAAHDANVGVPEFDPEADADAALAQMAAWLYPWEEA